MEFKVKALKIFNIFSDYHCVKKCIYSELFIAPNTDAFYAEIITKKHTDLLNGGLF